MAKKESKSGFERDYVIPLRKGIRKIVTYKKTPRAMREIRSFLEKHTKAGEVKLGLHLNKYMWASGIKNPPSKVKVHVKVADNVAKAELFGKEYQEPVKSEKKKAPETLKDKLTSKLGGEDKAEVKKEPVKTVEVVEEISQVKAEAPKVEEKPVKSPAQKKTAVKKQ
jgi:large subunit ribosomal protein L31e